LDLDVRQLPGRTCFEVVHNTKTQPDFCPYRQLLVDGRGHEVEVCEKRLGGDTMVSVSPLFDANGNLTGSVHIARDITLQKQLQHQLQQAQKMEALGIMAGGIAHDFNNLLMGILGNTALMLLETDSRHPYYSRLKTVDQLVHSGAGLTRQLLGMGGGGKYEVMPLDLNRLVHHTVEMFRRTNKDINLYFSNEVPIWVVEADKGQIEQVMLNLLVNASQAMPEGGNLHLQTANETLDEDFVRFYGKGPGRYVRITVIDTGIGMEPEVLGRIFDPFFTTKEKGRGTGLGLASAYGIIQSHKGLITVDSKKGEGSRFDVYLPASELKIIAGEGKPASVPARGRETVLLVDDEEIVLDVTADLLCSLGYQVLVAQGGRKAMDMFGLHNNKIDLVVLDLIMPDIGGVKVFDHIRQINGHVKVLLASGYGQNDHVNKILERGCDGFIQKPFDLDKLSGKIRDVLDRS
jgi:signal transduction histidine kinase/CheY-like chemotaxis protein